MYFGNMIFFFLLCATVIIVPIAVLVYGVYRLFFAPKKKVSQVR